MDQETSVKEPMRGFNTLTLCQAEMYQALQHYIDYRFGSNIAGVKQVHEKREGSVSTFEIGLLWDNNKV